MISALCSRTGLHILRGLERRQRNRKPSPHEATFPFVQFDVKKDPLVSSALEVFTQTISHFATRYNAVGVKYTVLIGN